MEPLRSIETFEPPDLMKQRSISEDMLLKQWCFNKLRFCCPEVDLFVFVFLAA